MKVLAGIILVVAIGFGIFGYWGMCTHTGRQAYDEMAGMIPFFAAVASGLLFFIFLILLMILIYKKLKTKK
ncbi:MAG: hypothetical protein ABIP51_20220 [Bacteroidia bacterium]